MLPHATDVTVRRVTLEGDGVTADTARQVRTALAQAMWPRIPHGETLLLRTIACHGNSPEIAGRAADRARRLALEAVDGWSAAAPGAPAVRFRSEDALVACLIRDLLLGQALERWYWQRWETVLRQPLHEALAALLEKVPLRFPAVVARLRPTPAWEVFWRGLGVAGALRVVNAVATAVGWSAALGEARAPAPPVREPIGGATASVSLTPDWDLSFLCVGDDDPRALLAALATVWRRAPALLRRAEGVDLWREVARATVGASPYNQGVPRSCTSGEVAAEAPVAGRGGSGDDAGGPGAITAASVATGKAGVPDLAAAVPIPPAPDGEKPEPRGMAADGKRDAGVTHGRPSLPSGACSRARSEGPGLDDGQGDLPHDVAGMGSGPGVTVRAGTRDRPDLYDAEGALRPLSAKGVAEAEPPAEAGELLVFDHDFITEQGGIFYLLNFLNIPPVLAELPADFPGAGWRWLYQLSRALDSPPEGELLAYLAGQCDTRVEELSREPQLPEIGRLLRIGARRYGSDIWCAATFRLRARLVAGVTHIDLHFRLDDARGAVRRTALDLDPGWLPWLGRVVTFHYGSGLEP